MRRSVLPSFFQGRNQGQQINLARQQVQDELTGVILYGIVVGRVYSGCQDCMSLEDHEKISWSINSPKAVKDNALGLAWKAMQC